MSRSRVWGSVVVVILLGPRSAGAADWHVAPGGVDGAAGTEDAPLATLAHAVSRAASGDSILLARGGTYAADDVNVGSGRHLDAYGTGADPVVTASVVTAMTGTWGMNANVLTASVAAPVLAVYADGAFMRLARYPNSGYLRVDNDESPDGIVDAELAARPGVTAGRWTGAQVRWRRWSWWWETRPIASHGPVDTLELGADGRFQDNFSDPGSAYFIDDSLDELDAPGEWFWGGGTLYVYPPAGTTKVEVVTSTRPGVVTSGTSITHVQFRRFVGTALTLNGPTTVSQCTFEQLENDAIAFTWGSQPFVIRNSVFRDVRNVAVSGWANPGGPTGTLIERNLFHRIGMEPGYGGSGSWHAAGLILGRTNGGVVRLNRIIDTGYAGILFGSDGQTALRNVIVRAMGTLNDGAGIYTNCNASIIRENIILDTIGNLETSHPWYPLGSGIWPEFLSDFHDTQIVDNTIYGSNGEGIFLPNNFTCTVTGNVAVDNRTAGLGLSGNAGDAQNHSIAGNTLAAVVPTRRITRPENLSRWWLPPYAAPTPVALQYQTDLTYGHMSGTTFIAPASGAGLIRPEGAADLSTLAGWTAAASWADATASRMVGANAFLLFNDTEASAAVPVPGGSWTLPDGTAVGATVTLEPFRSVVLVTSAPVPHDPPYVAASGIDWRAETPTTGVLTPEPEIEVRQGTTVIASGASDAVAPSVPGVAIVLSYTVVNTGASTLSVGVPVVVGDQVNCVVSATTQPSAAVAPNASAPLVVSVTPTAPGPWSFTISLATNDADESAVSWTVGGDAATGGDPSSGDPDSGTPTGSDPATGRDELDAATMGCGGCATDGPATPLGLVVLGALAGWRRRRRL